MSAAVQLDTRNPKLETALSPSVVAVFRAAAQVLKPPPKVSITEWAEQHRYMPSETTSELGFFKVRRTPYTRDMMDAVQIPGVREIVYWMGAQEGKSVSLENILAFFMREDPGPIIWIWPTEKLAKWWSGERLSPMLRDSPVLSSLIVEGSKKSRNAILFKSFPGGSLSILGANSAADLRGKQARLLICDDIDGFPPSAGPEGDVIELVSARGKTYWNFLRILASTCTIKNASRIEGAYLQTDQRKYHVPCPGCSQAKGELDGFQVLEWERLIFDKEPPYANTCYACIHCGAALTPADKPWMVDNGRWIATHPEIQDRVGFWLNDLYSPFITWPQMVDKFLSALHHRENPELMKTFVNLSLARTWEEQAEALDGNELMKRREDYPPAGIARFAPDGVTVITAAADVQGDRIELEAVGWGKGMESWSLDFQRFDGDPAGPEPWRKLDDYLLGARFLHARGIRLDIAATFVDSGYRANDVYLWTKDRRDRRIYACKGVSGFGKPPLANYNWRNRQKVRMYPVHVDVIKETLYGWLKISTPGAGYMHFSREKNDEEYFRQLTSERLVRKYQHGFPVRVWEKPPGARNEALDLRVYAYAAFLSLSSDPHHMLKDLREDLETRARQAAAARRAHADPNQLPLIKTEEVLETSPSQTTAPAADAKTAEPAADPGLGEHEYRVAEQLDAARPNPEPAPPVVRKVTVRRSSWL